MKIEVDLKDYKLGGLEKDIPYVTMLALNDTAFFSQKALKEKVKQGLTINKKSIINAFRIKKAKKNTLIAQIFVDDFSWQGEALNPHFYGGDRERKGMEKALSYMGAMSRDKILTSSGGIKIRPSVYVEMMSQLKLNYKAGYTANQSLNSKRRKRKNNTKYFIATKRDKRTRHLSEGIYARVEGYGYPLSILTISKKPEYKKRFDLETIVGKAIDSSYDKFFNKAILRAIATRKNF